MITQNSMNEVCTRKYLTQTPQVSYHPLMQRQSPRLCSHPCNAPSQPSSPARPVPSACEGHPYRGEWYPMDESASSGHSKDEYAFQFKDLQKFKVQRPPQFQTPQEISVINKWRLLKPFMLWMLPCELSLQHKRLIVGELNSHTPMLQTCDSCMPSYRCW